MEGQTARSVQRIFLSSTFIDMVAERDALQKSVFPSIAVKNGAAETVPIDLRWGIRDENTVGPRLVDLCLDSVARSTTFVGLIGQRYGTILSDHLLKKLLPSRSYLRLGISLTECEIRAAFALRELGLGPEHLIFAFRSDDWSFSDERIRLLLPERFQNYSPGDFSDTDPVLVEKLAKLKEFIRSQDCVVFEYSRPDECADRVRLHLERVLPVGSGRKFRRPTSDVVNSSAMSRLRDWRSRKQSRLVLVGANGLGKTQAIADFLAEGGDQETLCLFGDEHPSLPAALKWLEYELRRRGFDANEKRPIRRRAFEMVGAFLGSGNACLLLDGIERFAECPDLSWLPREPASVLVTLGTDSAWQTAFAERGFEIAEFPALSRQESHRLTKSLLSRYDKQEWPSISETINKRGLHNPQMIRTLTEGLHREVYETVDQAVKDYGDFTTATKLIARCWGRIVEDLERSPGEGVVRPILHFLAIDRSGIHSHDLDRLVQTALEANSSIAMANLHPFLKEEGGYVRLGSEAAFAAARTQLNPTSRELRLRWREFGSFFCDTEEVPVSRRFRALCQLGERSNEWSYVVELLRHHGGEILHNNLIESASCLGRMSDLERRNLLDELSTSIPLEACVLAAELGIYDVAERLLGTVLSHECPEAILRLAECLTDDGDASLARSHLMTLRFDELSPLHRLAILRRLTHVEINESNWSVSGRILVMYEQECADEDPLSVNSCWVALFQSRIESHDNGTTPTQRLLNLRTAFQHHEDSRGAGWAGLWMFDCHIGTGNYVEAESVARALIRSMHVGGQRIMKLACLRLATMYVHLDTNLDEASRLLNKVDTIPEQTILHIEITYLRNEIRRRMGMS